MEFFLGANFSPGLRTLEENGFKKDDPERVVPLTLLAFANFLLIGRTTLLSLLLLGRLAPTTIGGGGGGSSCFTPSLSSSTALTEVTVFE